ncbi:MAG: hypothetical protein LIO60_00970 [Oscillospiraceae bacterium]|nr:hypothetical protein [Oscillospiraceae bacterium]MCC8156979.1 hypothetical protein [Oscillospiraceae bacterium]
MQAAERAQRVGQEKAEPETWNRFRKGLPRGLRYPFPGKSGFFRKKQYGLLCFAACVRPTGERRGIFQQLRGICALFSEEKTIFQKTEPASGLRAGSESGRNLLHGKQDK